MLFHHGFSGKGYLDFIVLGVLMTVILSAGCSGPDYGVGSGTPLGRSENFRSIFQEHDILDAGASSENIVGWGDATLFRESGGSNGDGAVIVLVKNPDGMVIGVHLNSPSRAISPALDIVHGLWTKVCGASPVFRVAHAGGMTGDASMTADCSGDQVIGRWNRYGGSGDEAVLLVLKRHAGYAMDRMRI